MIYTDRTHSTSGYNSHMTQRISEYEQLELDAFEYTDHDIMDMEQDIDADNHFFSSTKSNCRHYTDDQYNQNIKSQGKLSIIHFNSRSLCKLQ